MCCVFVECFLALQGLFCVLWGRGTFFRILCGLREKLGGLKGRKDLEEHGGGKKNMIKIYCLKKFKYKNMDRKNVNGEEINWSGENQCQLNHCRF